MHRQHPLIAIWDDHETANNSWKGGAENHQPAAEGDWNARVAAAMQAYYEWMPVRPVDVNNLRDNHRRFAYGDLADLLMLEERLNARSEQLTTATHATPFGAGFATTDPGYGDLARTLLGDAEEAWLVDRLRTTPARWKLLGQGVMFAQLKAPGSNQATDPGLYFINSDQWDGYEPARNRLYAALKGDAANEKVDNLVVLFEGVRDRMLADSGISESDYRDAVASFQTWSRRPGAALWYVVLWAEGVRRAYEDGTEPPERPDPTP